MMTAGLEPSPEAFESWYADLMGERPQVGAHLAGVLERPELVHVAPRLAQAYQAIARSLEQDGTLYLCGNGGSMADALHISGEMLKSFKAPRPLPQALAERLRQQPEGEPLLRHLQFGLRAHVLGCNPALTSAVANDIPLAGIEYAQELVTLGRADDVLLGISTSGRARNVRLAVSVARAKGMTTIGLTGRGPNPLADTVDIAIAVPDTETYRVQELHIMLYHQLCLMLEDHFFPQ
jgi:D-sedoheptulose 7-phosphate isomerase